jgi:hypothetical protein
VRWSVRFKPNGSRYGRIQCIQHAMGMENSKE